MQYVIVWKCNKHIEV